MGAHDRRHETDESGHTPRRTLIPVKIVFAGENTYREDVTGL